jgi:hypothetical protein
MPDSPGEGSSPVRLSGGLPETVLPPEPADVRRDLSAALAGPVEHRWEAVSAVVRRTPRSLAGWDALGRLADDDLVAYACFRVGYHRGLDTLRAAGWRGSGLVRWAHEPNRPFLSCLDGLRGTAEGIGETDEAQRCAQFLAQLDPSWLSGGHGPPA